MSIVDEHNVNVTKLEDHYKVSIDNIDYYESVRNVGVGFNLTDRDGDLAVQSYPDSSMDTFGIIDQTSISYIDRKLSFDFYLGIDEDDIKFVKLADFANTVALHKQKAISFYKDTRVYLQFSEESKFNLFNDVKLNLLLTFKTDNSTYILNCIPNEAVKPDIFTSLTLHYSSNNQATYQVVAPEIMNPYSYCCYVMQQKHLTWSNVSYFEVANKTVNHSSKDYTSRFEVTNIDDISEISEKFEQNPLSFELSSLDTAGIPNFRVDYDDNYQYYYSDTYTVYSKLYPEINLSNVENSTNLTFDIIANYIGLDNETFYIDDTEIKPTKITNIYAVRSYSEQETPILVEQTDSSEAIYSENKSELKLDGTAIVNNQEIDTNLDQNIVANIEQGLIVKRVYSFEIDPVSSLDSKKITVKSNRFDDVILYLNTGYKITGVYTFLDNSADLEITRGYNSKKEDFVLFAGLYNKIEIKFADNIDTDFLDDITRFSFKITSLFQIQGVTQVSSTFKIGIDEETSLPYVYNIVNNSHNYLLFVEINGDSLDLIIGAENNGVDIGFNGVNIDVNMTIPDEIINDYNLSYDTYTLSLKASIVPTLLNEDVYRLDDGIIDNAISGGSGFVYPDLAHERVDYGNLTMPVDFYHRFDKDYLYVNNGINEPMYYHSAELVIPYNPEHQIEFEKFSSFILDQATNISSSLPYTMTDTTQNLSIYGSALADFESESGIDYQFISGSYLTYDIVQTLSSNNESAQDRAGFRFDFI
jgi:hypothetical protein